MQAAKDKAYLALLEAEARALGPDGIRAKYLAQTFADTTTVTLGSQWTAGLVSPRAPLDG